MVNWGNYCISKVKYNAAGTHIDSVEVRKYEGSTLGDPSIWTRSDVLNYIDNGYSFTTTIYRNNLWNVGETVEPIHYNGIRYLRTDKNSTPNDNLGNLPRL